MKKTEPTIALTAADLQSLIATAVAEAIKASKPARGQSEEQKAAKRAAKEETAARVVKAAKGLQLLDVEVSFLPKRQRFHPQRVWSKANPGPGLLTRFSPKDGAKQTWLVEEWSPAKTGNGFVAVGKFVPDEIVSADEEDFLEAVG